MLALWFELNPNSQRQATSLGVFFFVRLILPLITPKNSLIQGHSILQPTVSGVLVRHHFRAWTGSLNTVLGSGHVHCHQAFSTNQPMEDSENVCIHFCHECKSMHCCHDWQHIIWILSTLFNNTKCQIFTYTGHRSKKKMQQPGQQPPMHYNQRTSLI